MRNYIADRDRDKYGISFVQTILRLASRGYTVQELASCQGLSEKTARRRIDAIERAGIPVYTLSPYDKRGGRECQNVWRVDPFWARRILKLEVQE